MARFATDDEAVAYARMRQKIAFQRDRNLRRTQYAEGERLMEALDVRLPSGRMIEQTPLHWPQKAVDVFSSRLTPAFFSMRQGSSLLDDLKQAYMDADGAVVEQLAIKASLRHGIAFVFTSLGDPAIGEPPIIYSAQSALTATCTIDRRSGRVVEALEILDGGRDANLYLPGRTLHVQALATGRVLVLDEWAAPLRVQCAPYIHGATIEKPYGASRITKSIMALTDSAVRTFMRSEVSGEWYAQPRERLLGVGPEAFEVDPEDAVRGAVGGWVKSHIGATDLLPDIHPDDDPLVPDALRRASIEYAPQMSMQPFSDAFRLIASQFSGASSIPLSYLGIVQDSNPTSAPAIEAQDIDLVRAVHDERPGLGRGRRMLAANTLTLLHGDVPADELRGLVPRWSDARIRSLTDQGQFVATQIQAGNFQAGTRETLELLPISPEDVEAHALANQRAQGVTTVLDALTRAPAATTAATAEMAPVESAADLKAKADALGALIRSGVDPDDAAARVGLEGIEFTGAMPVSLRLPESEAAQLEGK